MADNRRVAFPRSIAFTVLVFNILLVFLPAAIFFFLDTHERLLLRSLEHALVQQARIFAGALSAANSGATAASEATGGQTATDVSASLQIHAEAIIKALRQRHDARLRVFDADSMLLVDSAQFGNAEWPELDYGRSGPADLAQESVLYQIGSLPTRIARAVFRAPDAPVSAPDLYQGKGPFTNAAEIQSALAGRYGATTRVVGSPDPAVILYSAIPVYAAGNQAGPVQTDAAKPIGVVLASQSTYRILRDLYVLRLELFRVVIASFFVALVVSLVLSFILIQPLRILSRQAAQVLDHRGRIKSGFKSFKGKNEIAVLSQSLADLGTRLDKQMRFVEGFSQDLVHEIRNPIASLRTSLELLSANVSEPATGGNTPGDTARFITRMQDDLNRMNALVGGIREISRIDVEEPGEDRKVFDLCAAVENSLERFRALYPRHAFRYECKTAAGDPGTRKPALVHLNPARFSQVIDNIVDNAVSFAPKGSTIDIELELKAGYAYIGVRDQGPGFPAADAHRLFDRFYSTRKAGASGHHTGLGLAIALGIVQSWGGEIEALPLDPGALFVVSVPLHPHH